jgi:alcohol dehydrogenase class IV
MAHPITAHFDVDHGSVVAALWPSYMRYALSNRFRLPQIGRYKRYALLGRQVFGVHETDDEVAAEITAHRFETWLRSSDIPASLDALGITALPTEQMAEEAVLVSGNGKRLPGGLSAADVEHIYEGALRS